MKKQYYIARYQDGKQCKQEITGEIIIANNREYGYIKQGSEYQITDIKTGYKITKHDQCIKSKHAVIEYIKQFDIMQAITEKQLQQAEEKHINANIFVETEAEN